MKSRHEWRHSFLLMICSAVIAAGCDIINPKETVPTVVHLEPFNFQVQPGQGSADNKITEVWMYANGNFLGAFNPPVDVYYLEEGPTQFVFRPGIRNNGIAGDAIVYPLFTGDTLDYAAMAGASLNVLPLATYHPKTIFSLLEDFELGNSFTDNRDTVAASELIQSTADVYEGQYSGQMVLSQEANFLEVSHSVPMAGLPPDGTPTYLEFRYKSEVEMSIGLLGINLDGQTSYQFFYLVRPSSSWNMLYIELTDLIEVSDYDAYKILFRSLYPAGSAKPAYNVFLDNIKVVHL